MVSFARYVEYMRKDKTWGDGTIISAAALLYNCPIVLLSITAAVLSEFSPTTSMHSTVQKQSMYLGFMPIVGQGNGGLNIADNQLKLDHYVSLVRIASTASTQSSPACASLECDLECESTVTRCGEKLVYF